MTCPASEDVRQLGEDLASADADRRAEAAERLAHAAEAAAAAVALVRACGDDDDRVREWVVAALEDLGPPPAEAVGGLIGLVGDPRPLVGYWATTLIGRSGQDGASAVPVLTQCLASCGDLAVRQRAAWALGKLGPIARPAAEVLRQAAAEGDERLARLATEAIEAIGG